MFQSEMENLELGLNLASSDLLFPDDLFNIPLDHQTNTTGLEIESGNIFGDEAFADPKECKMEQDDQDDLLAKIIEEVQLPNDTSSIKHEDVSFWEVNEDTSFVEVDTTTQNPLSPTSSDSSDDTQTLIDEMEEFLVNHEAAIQEVKEESTKTVLTQNMETEQAEEILDALISGNISLNDSGYSSGINNISEVQTTNGNNVIIVITNDDNLNPIVTMPPPTPSPAPSSVSNTSYASYLASPSSVVEEDEADSDWSPDKASPKAARKPREGKKRGPYKRSKPYNVKDKKERKKLQNVVAARRYRDKKKNEQVHIDDEVDTLTEKNKKLKQNLSEVEGELKTLKKLMLELGLVKISKNKKLVTI